MADLAHTPAAALCPQCGDSPCVCDCCTRCGVYVGGDDLCELCADALADEAYECAPEEYRGRWWGYR